MPLPRSLPWYDTASLALDRLPPDELQPLQLARLQTMVEYVYHSSPFWRHKLDQARVTPEQIRSLDDLRRLPFTTKEELQADQQQHPPFGSYVCSHPSTWFRVFTTSGTTGRPLRRVLSYRDWELCVRYLLRRWSPGHGKMVMVYLHPTEYAFGPSLGVEAYTRRGALIVPLGRYSSEQKVHLIHEVRPTSVSGTASYLLYLGRLAEEMDMPCRELGSIRSVGSVGEPGAAIDATQQRIRELWGPVEIGDGYGLTEIFGFGGGCAYSRGSHIPADMVITEVIDPETGEPVPPGEPGELVYTNLVCDTQPLLRYRSRDIGRLEPEPICGCGAAWPRIAYGVEGRADEMIWYRGVNVYPSAVEQAVRSIPELADEFQIVLRGTIERPELVIRVEPRTDNQADERLVTRAEEKLRETLGVRARVELCTPGSLPRTDYKARRVVDERAKE